MDAMYNPNEPLIRMLRMIIRFGVRCMAILMTLVILLGVVDVGVEIYQKLMTPPFMMLTISDLLASFGAFMAVLIAIEIFINITIYLRHDVIHVQIVMATALMAIARKVIILDFKTITPDYMFATALLVFAMGMGYWFVVRNVDAKTVYCDQIEGRVSDSAECEKRNEHSMASDRT
jgi:uncharacterized membrane protein (DUF373 family)